GGERSVVIKDTFGHRHLMPSSVAAKVIGSEAEGYIREVYLARDQNNPKELGVSRGTGAKQLVGAIEQAAQKAIPEKSPAPDLAALRKEQPEEKFKLGSTQAN